MDSAFLSNFECKHIKNVGNRRFSYAKDSETGLYTIWEEIAGIEIPLASNVEEADLSFKAMLLGFLL